MPRLLVCIVLGTSVASAIGIPQSNAASANTTVSVTIASVTNLSTLGCQAPSTRSFGALLPGTLAITPADCSVTFGSSNDSSSLRIRQSDAGGSAMYLPADGTLDTNYDGDGYRVESVFTGRALDSVLQPSGEQVVVGYSNSAVIVARYLPDGTLDASFNAPNGYRVIDVGPCADQAGAVALEPDGQIVVAGRRMNQNMFAACDDNPVFNTNPYDTMLIRLNGDGTLDGGFGVGGIAIANAAAWEDSYGVAIAPDGRIVTAGTTGANVISLDGTAMRFTTTGGLQATQIVYAAPSGWNDYLYRVNVLDDGSVRLVGAAVIDVSVNYDTVLVGLTPAFAMDPAFGGGGTGKRLVDLGGSDGAFGLAVQPDGKLLVSGLSSTDAVVSRHSADGATLDPSFGVGGIRTVDLGSADDAGTRMALEADGRVLVTGATSFNMGQGSASSQLALFRLTDTGAVDTTFSQDGIYTLDASGGADVGFGISPVIDGTITVGGMANGNRFLTVRMSGEPIDDWQDGVRDWDQGTNAFGACLHAYGLSSPVWTHNAACAAVDGSFWRPVPTADDTIATTLAGESNATVGLRFGLRTKPSQRPGNYIAPVTFDVVAPAV